MLLFGHLGITLGAALVITRLAKYPQKASSVLSPASPGQEFGGHPQQTTQPVSSGMNLTEVVFCLIGSILPDLIDKPAGQLFFGQIFGHNGRIFSHTLLFLLLCLLTGLYFYFTRKKFWLLYLAFGILTHLLLDFMWETPQTLFWPFLGWHFPASKDIGLSVWVAGMFQELRHNPPVFIPEIIGFLVMAGFLALEIKTGQIVIPLIKRKR